MTPPSSLTRLGSSPPSWPAPPTPPASTTGRTLATTAAGPCARPTSITSGFFHYQTTDQERLAFTRPRCLAADLELASVDFATVEAQPVGGGEEIMQQLKWSLPSAGLRWGGNKSNENGLCLHENHLHARPTTYSERKSALYVCESD